jgi:hypothetical protein
MKNLQLKSMFNSKDNFLQVAFAMVIAIASSTATMAQQRDSTKKTTIDITSSYRPVLRNAVKINFSASHAAPDTTLPVLKYDIPAQNLFYSYQPVPLQPMALEQDSNLYLGTRNFVKLGFGNFSTPYVNAGFSFGDGKKTLLNLYAAYISSKGKIKNQDYSQMNIKATGSYFTAKNEVYGGTTVSMNNNYLYGYNHTVYDFKKNDNQIQQQFLDMDVHAGMRNTVIGEYGISYNPSLRVTNFTVRDKLNETSVILTAPVEKQFGGAFVFKAEARADITSYTTKNLSPGNVRFSNNVIQVAPSLVFSKPGLTVNGGIIPTWDNGKFVWLPNVYAEAQIMQNAFSFQAGWVGRYTKNTYRNLSAINPWLSTLASQKNTKEVEYYGGIKATLAKHFNLNAKVGLVHYTDLPFFINDTSTATSGKDFVLSNESSVNNLRVHGDISYISRDKFTATAGITFNGYTLMKDNARAWNTVPMEFNASLRWWAFRQVLLKADFYAFGGGHYLVKGNTAAIFRPGSDLSAGAEFKINKMFSAWMDVNNILSDKYQRWHNYEVYGLNFIGGVKVSF